MQFPTTKKFERNESYQRILSLDESIEYMNRVEDLGLGRWSHDYVQALDSKKVYGLLKSVIEKELLDPHIHVLPREEQDWEDIAQAQVSRHLDVNRNFDHVDRLKDYLTAAFKKEDVDGLVVLTQTPYTLVEMRNCACAPEIFLNAKVHAAPKKATPQILKIRQACFEELRNLGRRTE